MSDENFLQRANQIMDDAVTKAGDLLCSSPMIAEIILKQLLKCDPEHLAGLQLLGLCKHRMGQNAEAVEIISTAIELDPTNGDNHNNLGLAYAGLGDHVRAVKAITKAIELKPEQFLFKNNLALQLRLLNRHEEAVSMLAEVAATQNRPQLYLNLGGIYGEMKELDKAEECFKRALEIDPNYPAAQVDMAFCSFLRGDYEKGFKHYEYRFTYYPQMTYYMNSYDQTKAWDGKASLENKTVLVYGEQGLGDIIQFARYARRFKGSSTRLLIHCPESLWKLVKNIEGVAGVVIADIVTKRGSLPEYDYQISMMSFPALLNDYSPTGESYIKAPTDAFRDHMKSKHKDTFNVGVVWAGSPAHPNDQKRSIPLKHFRKIHDLPGVKLFSLQLELGQRQYGITYRNSVVDRPDMRKPVEENFQPLGGTVDYTEDCRDMTITDLTKMITSWEDTATILAGLDLVICCDTAIAHLAGAMGVPCWVALPYNPDWRWGLTGDRTPWYDSLKLFRQETRNDWDTVFTNIAEELDATFLQNK